MKQYRKLAIGVASVGIALAAAAAFAQSGPMGGGMGSMMGMHGKMSASMHGGPDSDHKAGQQLMTPQEREALHEKMRNAKTPADHLKLQNHFLAVAAKYEADATEHAAEAQAYRKNPTFMESKNPVGPGTATHCDRFAELDRQAAKEARDLASAHQHMAAAK